MKGCILLNEDLDVVDKDNVYMEFLYLILTLISKHLSIYLSLILNSFMMKMISRRTFVFGF
jgi:hypothetical protein